MEALVIDEVEQQLKFLPQKIARYLKPYDVTAYALNRLPALYATSKRGWQRQWHHGKTKLQQQIATAVRQGIAAVERDPLRADIPLFLEDENKAMIALQELKVLLQSEALSWDNLVDVVEQSLSDTLQGNITWCQTYRSDKGFDWENYPLYHRG